MTQGEPLQEQAVNLFVVRHGETSWHSRRMFIGQGDPPLSCRGWQQTLKKLSDLGQHVNGEARPVIVCSDLVRAQQTARIVGPITHVSSHWRELDFGAWTGKTYRQILESQDAERLHAWFDDPWGVSPPGGESLLEMMIRVRRGINEVLGLVETGPRTPTVVIVSHGGPTRAFDALYRGQPRDLATYWMTPLGNAEFSQYHTNVQELTRVGGGEERDYKR